MTLCVCQVIYDVHYRFRLLIPLHSEFRDPNFSFSPRFPISRSPYHPVTLSPYFPITVSPNLPVSVSPDLMFSARG
jgi:hypothetical protein